MRILSAVSIALLISGGLFAQKFNGAQPFLSGGFGNVVFPGGTAATVPGTVRTTGNFTSPIGGPRLVVPGANVNHGQRRATTTPIYTYYPYLGGYGYGYGNGYMGDAPAEPQQPQQPNVMVIYPPQAAPVIINQYGQGDNAPANVHPRMYDVPAQPEDDASTVAPPEASHYLLAFKDHTIYSAANYWVDGDTLHYFTSGNTHNQVSLSLVDRDLTLRLNKESGNDMKLPVSKQ